MHKEDSYLFVITSATGRDISELSFFGSESEVLFRPNSKFTVTKVFRKNDHLEARFNRTIIIVITI